MRVELLGTESRCYTYLIGWSESDTWYYGVRYAKGCNPTDLWVKYFTSSKFVKEFRKHHGNPDVVQVRRVFKNCEAARDWEHKVCRRLNVSAGHKWLNKHNGGSKFMCTGHSEKTKAKLSKARKGRKPSAKAIEIIGNLNRGKALSEGVKQKISDSMKGRASQFKGKKHTEQSLVKLRRVYEFIDPCGKIVSVANLKKFCADWNLSYEGMKRTANGDHLQHKGYTTNPPKIFDDKASKLWLLYLQGRRVEIFNLKSFCKELGLSYGSMKKVAHGEKETYQGYSKYV